jgi:hypothetical protein
MPKPVSEIRQALVQRGLTPHGLAYVLELLADENEEGTARRRLLGTAATELREDQI